MAQWLSGSVVVLLPSMDSNPPSTSEQSEQSKLPETLQSHFCKSNIEAIPSPARLIVLLSIGFSTVYSHGQTRRDTLSPSTESLLSSAL